MGDERVLMVAKAINDALKDATESVNGSAWIGVAGEGYGGEGGDTVVTPLAVTLDGEFDLLVLARAAIKAVDIQPKGI